jgi:hypothetical protein
MEIFALIAHLVSTLVRVDLPGGVRAVIVESLLLKHQLLVLSRSRKRAPSLTPWDRLLFGIGAFLVSPKRLPKIAIGIRPSTLLRFHRALMQRKYRLLFTPAVRRRPGPMGPRRNSLQRFSRSSAAIRDSGARELPNRLPMRSVSKSPRMWCAASSLSISDVPLEAMVHPGSPSSETQRTACRALISFDANPSCSRPTGSWPSWISLHARSSASAWLRLTSTA